MYSVGLLENQAGERRNNRIMSFLQKMSRSLPEQAYLPTALWHTSNPALYHQSNCPGDKHRTHSTNCSVPVFSHLAWLAQVPSAGSWNVWRERFCPHRTCVQNYLQLSNQFKLSVPEMREPWITKPLPAEFLPGGHISFIDYVTQCYELKCVSPKDVEVLTLTTSMLKS